MNDLLTISSCQPYFGSRALGEALDGHLFVVKVRLDHPDTLERLGDVLEPAVVDGEVELRQRLFVAGSFVMKQNVSDEVDHWLGLNAAAEVDSSSSSSSPHHLSAVECSCKQ